MIREVKDIPREEKKDQTGCHIRMCEDIISAINHNIGAFEFVEYKDKPGYMYQIRARTIRLVNFRLFGGGYGKPDISEYIKISKSEKDGIKIFCKLDLDNINNILNEYKEGIRNEQGEG